MNAPDGYISAEDLAKALKLTIGAVYKRASDKGWTRIKYGRQVFYRVKDM